MNSLYKVVDRTYDYLPSECCGLDKLKDRLLQVFTNRGYRKIDTPILEKYDLFAKGVGFVPNHKLFKVTDLDGSLLVLRPDMTLPIARVINTKMNNIHKYNKLCYVANSYSLNPTTNAMREFTQAGVELYDKSSPYVDADLIALAVNTLINSGLQNFQIDIGHVGYFNGMLNNLELTELEKDELVKLVDAKDSFGLELFAKNYGITDKLSAILSLPAMFGGVEVLAQAKELANNQISVDAINNLQSIYEILVQYGLDNYITFDLGLVNGISYYSGVVFKGITRYFGGSVLSGGRYDNLSDSFGCHKPATGFAIGVNNLLVAIKNENGDISTLPNIDVLVGGDLSQLAKINELINIELANGKIVENSYESDFANFSERVVGSSVIKAIYVDKNGKVNEVYNG